MSTSKEYVSPLAQAIADRKRKIHEFDISGFFGLAGKEVPKLGVRVPTKAEQDEAIRAAHNAATAMRGSESAKSDDDIIRDLKTVHILQRACLEPTPKKKPSDQSVYYDPSFPGPEWMSKNMTTEQIGVLLNILNDVRRVEAPGPSELDDVTIDVFHDTATKVEPGAMADFLAGCDREFVCQLFIIEAHRLQNALERAEALVEQVEALEARVKELSPPASSEAAPEAS